MPDDAAPAQAGGMSSKNNGMGAIVAGSAAVSDADTQEEGPGVLSNDAAVSKYSVEADAESLAKLIKVDESMPLDPRNGHESLPSSQPETRNTVSKIANLRAAFEKGTSNEVTPKRNFGSSERKGEWHQERDKEVARLKEDLEKERELRIAYEDKCSALEDELHTLHSNFERQSSVWQEEWEQKSHAMKQEHGRALEQLQSGKSENIDPRAIELQRQITDLKRSISTSTRIESQVSDSTFAQEMGMINHELQNWIVNNFRRAKATLTMEDLHSRLEQAAPRQMEGLLSLYRGFEAAARLAFYQATAMVYLMKIFEDELLYGLPDDLEWSRCTGQAVDSLRSVLNASAFSKWRAITLDSVRQSEGMEAIVEKTANRVSGSICVTLCAVTDSMPSEAMTAQLNAIIKRTISLAHLFRVQRSQYAFALPSAGSDFDPNAMEDTSLDDDHSSDHKVRCATFPLVMKIGDAAGDNPQIRNIILKAKVTCDGN